MKYILLEDDGQTILQNKVNEAIQDGWKPQGGVSVSITLGYNTYIQAMIKEE